MSIKFLCEDSLTKGLYDHWQSNDLHSRSQVHLKLDYFLTCNISDSISDITFKLVTTVDLWMPHMLALISMILTLMQGHSGSAKAKNLRCMLAATKQAISIKLATTTGQFYVTLTLQTFTWLDHLVLHDLDFENIYMAGLSVCCIAINKSELNAAFKKCECSCTYTYTEVKGFSAG